MNIKEHYRRNKFFYWLYLVIIAGVFIFIILFPPFFIIQFVPSLRATRVFDPWPSSVKTSCWRFTDQYGKDSCWRGKAIAYADEKLCVKIVAEGERDVCLKNIARIVGNKGSEERCQNWGVNKNQVVNTNTGKEICLTYAKIYNAILNKDPSFCESIVDEYYKTEKTLCLKKISDSQSK